jgi:hypothetical protein
VAVWPGVVSAGGAHGSERTYGHLLPDSLDRARAALDTFVKHNGRAGGERRRTVSDESETRCSVSSATM